MEDTQAGYRDPNTGGDGPVLGHQTFVQAAVGELLGTLAYDSSGWKNAALRSNLARIQSNSTHADTTPGRTALDCRLALGADDEKYLWQGVHLLWTSGADEALSVSPSSLLPQETREAMATGLVGGFERIISVRRTEARNKLATTVRLVAWLLSMKVVRKAVIDACVERGTLTAARAAELDNAYTPNVDDGQAFVVSMGELDSLVEIRGLVDAIAMLLDENGTPMRATDALLGMHVDRPLKRLEEEQHRLLSSFLLLGPSPTTWCNSSRYDASLSPDAAFALGLVAGRNQRGVEDEEPVPEVEQQDASAARGVVAGVVSGGSSPMETDSDSTAWPSPPRDIGTAVYSRPYGARGRSLRAFLERKRGGAISDSFEEDPDIDEFWEAHQHTPAPSGATAGAAPGRPSQGLVGRLTDHLLGTGRSAPVGADEGEDNGAGVVPGGTPGADADADADAEDAPLGLCDTRDPNPDLVDTSSVQFADAAYVAFQRIHGVGTKQSTISPFWKSRTDDWWETTFLTNRFMPPAPTTAETLRALIDTNFTRGGVRKVGHSRKCMALPDSRYIQYTLARGLCASLGAHEAPTGADFLRYDYPTGELGATTEELARLVEAAPSEETHAAAMQAIATDSQRLYDQRLVLEDGLAGAMGYGEFAQAALTTGTDGKPLEPAQKEDSGQEPAAQVRWAPVSRPVSGDDASGPLDVDCSLLSAALCKASVHEHLLLFLKQRLASYDTKGGSTRDKRHEHKTLRAVAAAIKLRQMQSVAVVASTTVARSTSAFAAAPATPSVGAPMLEPNGKDIIVTRTPVHCGDDDRTMLFPVDVGLACFESAPDASNITIPFDTADAPLETCSTNAEGVKSATPAELTSWLREGIGGSALGNVEVADDGVLATGEEPDLLNNLYLGQSAQNTPFRRVGGDTRGRRRWGSGAKVKPASVAVGALRGAVAAGMGALRELEQIEHEEALLARVRTEDSVERRQLFQLTTSAEALNRDRRGGLWQEALREIAVSTDKLLTFVRMLSGGLNEEVSDLIRGEDPEVLDTQRQARERRAELARRSMQFQTRLIEQVMSSVFKADTLSLDLVNQPGDCATDNRLSSFRVRSANAKAAISDAAAGTGKPFFESNVQLQQLLGSPTAQLKLPDLLRELTCVGQLFHQEMLRESETGGGAARLSKDALALPRNSYMVRLNDKVCTAINDTFVELNRRIRREHSHMMRHVFLWELIEGPWNELCTTFCELVRSQIQYTASNDTVATQYLNSQIRSSISYKRELMFHKTIRVLCEYLPRFGVPNFTIARKPPVPLALPGPSDGGDASGGGDDDDDDDEPLVPVDTEALRVLWNFQSRRLARRNTAARRGPSGANMTPSGIAGGSGGVQPPVTPPSVKATWLQTTKIHSWGAQGVASIFRYLVCKVSLGYFRGAPVTGSLADDGCEVYYSSLPTELQRVAVEACRQYAVNANGRKLIRLNVWRYQPGMPSGEVQVTPRNGKGDVPVPHYVAYFDSAELNANDDELVSRALNAMFELPDDSDRYLTEADRNDPNVDLRWYRGKDDPTQWVRREWSRDAHYREMHSRVLRLLQNVGDVWGSSLTIQVVVKTTAVLAFALLAAGYTFDAEDEGVVKSTFNVLTRIQSGASGLGKGIYDKFWYGLLGYVEEKKTVDGSWGAYWAKFKEEKGEAFVQSLDDAKVYLETFGNEAAIHAFEASEFATMLSKSPSTWETAKLFTWNPGGVAKLAFFKSLNVVNTTGIFGASTGVLFGVVVPVSRPEKRLRIATY